MSICNNYDLSYYAEPFVVFKNILKYFSNCIAVVSGKTVWGVCEACTCNRAVSISA